MDNEVAHPVFAPSSKSRAHGIRIPLTPWPRRRSSMKGSSSAPLDLALLCG